MARKYRKEAERLVADLRRCRKERGLTQEELGRMAGLKQSAVARAEKGSGGLNLQTAISLLAPLGKTLSVVPIAEVERQGDEKSNSFLA